LPNKIIIGHIGAPYGLKGWVKVQSFTDPKSNICAYSQGWLQYPAQKTWEPYQASTKQLSKAILFKFPDYDDPETARELTGTVLAVERQALPKLQANEYYWSDLEDLTVITKSGLVLGSIDHFIPTGANDVMVVKKANTLRLIPYIDPVVVKVDLVRGELLVDWDPEF
jgi:16S rRNA processing protein RimM